MSINSPTPPADHLARRQALDPSQSFAVSAPAGSGKTGLLTQRVLKLLAASQDPEEVLCITFTRKAAAEMQLRVMQALQAAAQTPEPPKQAHELLTWQLAQAVLQQDAKQNWRLLFSPSRLRIQTIDGFSRNLAGQLPLASGLGALPDTLEHPDQAYNEAVQDVFNRIEQDDELFQHWQRLLQHLDNNVGQTQKLLIGLLGKRDQWLEAVHYLFLQQQDGAGQFDFNLLAVEHLIKESLAQSADKLAEYASELAIYADYAGSQLLHEGKEGLALLAGIKALPSADETGLSSWQQLCDLLLKADDDWRKTVTKNNGFPAGNSKQEKAPCKERKQGFLQLLGQLREIPGLLEQLQQIRLLPDSRSTQSLQEIVNSLAYLLVFISAQLKVVFRRHGATDFIELGQAALQALGNEDEPEELALKLDYQIRHILVDEFQDTAEPQLRLLQKLTAGWEANDGRSLFIVGDGMQSCYGFRNANVGLFLEARRHGIGSVKLTALDLTVNFRSQTGVVEWVNQSFSQAFPPQDDIARGAVRYSASIAFKPLLDARACQLEIFAGQGPEQAQQLKQCQAQAVVAKVQAILTEQPQDNIAILVRNRSHLQDILPQLQAAGLKWLATDIDPLASRMVIQDLLSLCRAMLSPGDRIAWLALLRSPWLGLDMTELWQLCNQVVQPLHDGWGRPLLKAQIQHWQQLDNIGQSSQTRLRYFNQVLEQAERNRQRKPLRQWIEGIWLVLGGPSSLLNSEDMDNVQSFFELLEKQGYIIDDWSLFERAVDKLYAKPDAEADPRLQVMTIHKSKGLEFDHVIIPGLERSPRSNDKELLLMQRRINQQGHSDLMLAPIGARGENDAPLYRYIRHEAKLKLEFEATRLLYVGCTRAIKHLYLFASAYLSEDQTDIKTPQSSSLLAKIWPLEDAIIHKVGATEPTEDGSNYIEQADDFILRLAPEWTLPAQPMGNLLQAYRGQELASDDDNIPEPYHSEQAYYRHLGTVLHRCLRQITLDGAELWNSARLQRQQPFWQAQLKQLGLWPEACTHAADTIAVAIQAMLSDRQGQWLLNHQHLESHCELSLWSNGAESILDRCIVDQGQRWVIDYKSSQPKAGQTLEDFLQEEAETYTGQLQRYRVLAQKMGAEPVIVALYFPLIKELYRLDSTI